MWSRRGSFTDPFGIGVQFPPSAITLSRFAMVGLPASRNRDNTLMVVMPFLPARTDSFRNEYH
jgi:hypothetical protein